jgi:hypothetical protein
MLQRSTGPDFRVTGKSEVEHGEEVWLARDFVKMHLARTGNIVAGLFTPVLAKHSKSFSLIDCVSVGVDRMQRNFEPMRRQVEACGGPN